MTTSSPLIALLNNAALLLALVVLFDVATSRKRLEDRPLWIAFVGTALGGVGIGLMTASFRLQPGVVFDMRSVLLSVSGLFFGAIPTVVAMAMTAAFRAFQGGAGAWTGMLVIVVTGCMGIAWRHYRRESLADISWLELLGFGVVVGVVVLALLATLPSHAARPALAVMALPMLVASSAGTVAFGLLLAGRLRRERAEAELRDKERLLSESQRIGRIGSWVYHLDGRVAWSEETYRIFGVSPDTFALNAASFFNLIHPDDRPSMEAWIETCLSGADAGELVFRSQLPDGTTRIVSGRGEVVRGLANQPPYLAGTAQDVTDRKRSEDEIRQALASVEASRRVLLGAIEDRKQAEAALSRLNIELERRVLDRTAELSAANQELDSFSHAVFHDLRAPLRAMRGFSLAVLEDHGKSLPEETRVHLAQIQKATEHMGRLIDGLMLLSRGSRGELRHGTVDLSALARRLCRDLADAEPARAVAWHVDDGLTAWGDARMLEVALANLLENAWKYTAGCATPSVRVYAEPEGERVWYCVADNGAGFDMRDAHRLFRPFQRLHHKSEFSGMGIGLATVQRVVHRHGGTVSAVGAVGQGATFRFCLPAAASRLEEAS